MVDGGRWKTIVGGERRYEGRGGIIGAGSGQQKMGNVTIR